MRATLDHRPKPGAAQRAWLLCAAAALLCGGCALTSKSEPIAPRYFSPERPAAAAPPGVKPVQSPYELRLGRVFGSSHLDERLVYRDSDYQLGYYEERRWTEEPAEYLRRCLARVLFEDRGLRHVVGGVGPSLEVELTGFEEIRSPKRVARVQMTVRLQDARTVRWEETMIVEQPITDTSGDPASTMVAAISVALGAAVDRVADRVVSDLATTPPPPPASSATTPRPRLPHDTDSR